MVEGAVRTQRQAQECLLLWEDFSAEYSNILNITIDACVAHLVGAAALLALNTWS